MNILGFNPAHHGSVCLLQDGEIKYFIQEERIGNRKKYVSLPFKTFIDILQNYKIDRVTWGTPSMTYPVSSHNNYPLWPLIASSYNANIISDDYSPNSHHYCHVAHSFFNSGFKKAIGVVIDGVGSECFKKNDEIVGQETETIYTCSYPANFKVLHKNGENLKKDTVNLSKVYETITMHLGWSRDEAGKTMGLAPYGKFNHTFPPFFQNKTGNPNVFFVDKYLPSPYFPGSQQTYINEKINPQLKLVNNPREWHYNESKITDLEKDLAWKVQNDTQQLVGDYIEKAIKETGLKQVCCSGGYFLNCVTNYYLLKRFPDIEFYFEPISNDAGTAIGAAKLVWYHQTKDTTIRPFKSLYLGKQYSKEELLKGIKKYT
jgi:carbamoyltransferase|tara:strand:- start:2873 stop:3994 length:1122 start_codon:yes stop_codon:yes gene_type:complete